MKTSPWRVCWLGSQTCLDAVRISRSERSLGSMKSIYFENDDILQIRVSDKPIVCKEAQNRHTPHGFCLMSLDELKRQSVNMGTA